MALFHTTPKTALLTSLPEPIAPPKSYTIPELTEKKEAFCKYILFTLYVPATASEGTSHPVFKIISLFTGI
jgi:hypothetical protein